MPFQESESCRASNPGYGEPQPQPHAWGRPEEGGGGLPGAARPPFLIALSGAAEGELARAGVFHHTLVKPVGRRELGDLLREAKRQIRL